MLVIRCQMATKLIEYGRQIQDTFGLREKRKPFTFDPAIITMPMPDHLHRFLTDLVGEPVSYFEIVNRVFNPNQSLKFHIDDCQIVSRREVPLYDTHRFIPITDTLYIYIVLKI